MTAQSRADAHPPRLNPFAFPSDTDCRFALLVVSVLGASLFIYNLLYVSVPSNNRLEVEAATRCMPLRLQYPVTEALRNLANLSSDAMVAYEDYLRCLAPSQQRKAGWMLGGAVLVLGMAGLLYWWLPAWKIRRDGLVVLKDEHAPGIMSHLAGLCDEGGLSRRPVFLLNPLNSSANGLAFGRLGRYYVVLHLGLVRMRGRDPAVFRAVVLHELAHLRNADVDKTYFSVAIWWAFVVAALVPFVVSLLAFSVSIVLHVALRVLALAALVYLTLAAVLRAREVYADARAATDAGAADGLGDVLEGPSSLQTKRWWRVLDWHPEPARRRRVLRDTRELFALSVWDAFATGLAVAVAFPSAFTLLLFLTTGTRWAILPALFAAALFAPLIVGVVGVGMWRATFAALAVGETPRGAGRLGLGLTAGLVLGHALSLSISQLFAPEAAVAGWVSYLWAHALWGLLVLPGFGLFLRWIAATAAAWLGVALASRSPRPVYTAGLAVACVVLAAWLGAIYFGRLLFDPYPLMARGAGEAALLALTPVAAVAVGFPLLPPALTLPALVGVWALPLAAGLWRDRVAAAPASSWALLGPASQRLAIPPPAPLRLGLALRAGLIGALLYSALLLAVRLLWRFGVPEATRATDQARLVFGLGQIAAAVLVQVGVAVVVAAWVGRLGWAHALLAAFVAGCAMAVAILGMNLLAGGLINADFVWLIVNMVVNYSGFAVLPVAVGVSAVVGSVHRVRQTGVAAE